MELLRLTLPSRNLPIFPYAQDDAKTSHMLAKVMIQVAHTTRTALAGLVCDRTEDIFMDLLTPGSLDLLISPIFWILLFLNLPVHVVSSHYRLSSSR